MTRVPTMIENAALVLLLVSSAVLGGSFVLTLVAPHEAGLRTALDLAMAVAAVAMLFGAVTYALLAREERRA